MENLKWRFLGVLLLLPLGAFAHGEEVLSTFFIQTISIFLFIILLISLKNGTKRKLILTSVYFLAVMLTWYYIEKLPYLANINKINTLIAAIPAMVVVATFLALRLLSKRQV